MKAICSGFQETTYPLVCLSEGLISGAEFVNVMWYRVCYFRVMVIRRVKLLVSGNAWSTMLNAGRKGDMMYSFQLVRTSKSKGVSVLKDSEGDGIKDCIDIDECREKSKCQCPDCLCNNKWGGYNCESSNEMLYIHEHDTCISKKSQQSKIGWTVFLIVLIGVATLAAGGYVLYKYRLRSCMDSEIRAIMMPFDSSNDLNHRLNEDP